MASAPWNAAQFSSKGIDVIVKAVEKIPNLKVTFLWRNIEYEMIHHLENDSPAKDRINVVNKKVDVVRYIQEADAGILLSKDASIIKSFPHSLLECPAFGKTGNY